MQIMYMKNDPPVNVECLLKVHNITEDQLNLYIEHAKDNKFSIDGNKYYLEDDEKKPKSPPTYNVTREGHEDRTGLKGIEVEKIVEKTSNTIRMYFKNGNSKAYINGWDVERVERK